MPGAAGRTDCLGFDPSVGNGGGGLPRDRAARNEPGGKDLETVGSASTLLASGAIFTVPALFLWGIAPPYLQVVALCFLGGVLGLAAMIPLRGILIIDPPWAASGDPVARDRS